MKVLLHEMSWREAKEYFAKSDNAILPLGSKEEHGAANPLGTDHLIAKGIAIDRGYCERIGKTCQFAQEG